MLIRRMPTYKDIFVRKGGLKYLYDLFILKSFFTGPIDRSWCAGLPDTLLYTLKILCSCLLKIPTPAAQPIAQPPPTSAPPPPSSAPPLPPPLPPWMTTATATDEQHSPRTPMNTRKKVSVARSVHENLPLSHRLAGKRPHQRSSLLSHRRI